MLETNSSRWWTLGVLSLAVLVVGLDITVLNVALPTIAASLHAGTAELQWIVDAYVLAFAGALLLRDTRPAAPRRADVGGSVLAAATVVALVFAVVHAPERGWLAPGTLGLLLAPAAGAARNSVVGAEAVADRLGPGGETLRHAAGEAFTAGMSGVLLTCAVLVALSAVACARFLPARGAHAPVSLAAA